MSVFILPTSYSEILNLNPWQEASGLNRSGGSSSVWREALTQIHTGAQSRLNGEVEKQDKGFDRAKLLLKNHLFRYSRKLYYLGPYYSLPPLTLKSFITALTGALDKLSDQNDLLREKYEHLRITRTEISNSIGCLRQLLKKILSSYSRKPDIEFSKLLSEFAENGEKSSSIKSMYAEGAKALLVEILGLFVSPSTKTLSKRSSLQEPNQLTEIEKLKDCLRSMPRVKINLQALAQMNFNEKKESIIQSVLNKGLQIFCDANCEMTFQEFATKLKEHLDQDIRPDLDKSSLGALSAVKSSITHLSNVISRLSRTPNHPIKLIQIASDTKLQQKLKENGLWSNGGGAVKELCLKILNSFNIDHL